MLSWLGLQGRIERGKALRRRKIPVVQATAKVVRHAGFSQETVLRRLHVREEMQTMTTRVGQ